MGLEYIKVIEIAIASGFFGSLLAALKWYVERRDRLREEKVVKGLQSIFEGFEHMDEMVQDEIERVMLFAGHNCGGIPRLNASFYVTALRAVDQGSIIDWKDYKHIEADHEYIKMLLRTMNESSVRISTDDMPPCKLKEYYQVENITESVIIFLKVVGKELIYVSASTRNPEGLSANTVTKLQLKANLLKECL